MDPPGARWSLLLPEPLHQRAAARPLRPSLLLAARHALAPHRPLHRPLLPPGPRRNGRPGAGPRLPARRLLHFRSLHAARDLLDHGALRRPRLALHGTARSLLAASRLLAAGGIHLREPLHE